MEAFARSVSLLAIPLALINMFGGIVSGIWLAILGEWGLIGYGIVALLVAGMGLGLAMAPGLLFAGPAVALLEKGYKFLGYLFGFIGNLYIFIILVGWCIMVLLFCISRVGDDSIIPILIWSYGVATGPITWLAQKDSQAGNEYSAISTFFIQVAYILTVLAILFAGFSLINVIVLFAVVMSIGLIFQFSIALRIDQAREERL